MMNDKKFSSLAQIMLLLPKSQFEELLILAKELGCKDIVELVSRSLELSKLLADTKRRNLKIVAYDRSKITEIISEKEERVIVICESKDAYIDIEEALNETMNINSQISETNGWGWPTETFKA